MADLSVPVAPAETSTPAAPASAPPPAAPLDPARVLAEQRAGSRAATLAGLKALSTDGVPPAAAPAAVVAPVAVDPDAEVETPAEPEPETPAEPEVESPKPPAVEEPAGAAAIRKLEQHTRRQLAEERLKQQADLDAQKSTWAAKVAKAEEVERKLAAGREDPVALLKLAGFSDDDLAAAGRLIYGSSTEGAKDPRYKQAGEAALAKTQEQTRTQKLEAKIEALEKNLSKRDEQAQIQANIDFHSNRLVKAIPADSPIAKAYAKHPDKVRQALYQVADELYTTSGPSPDLRDVPTPAEVFARYEKQRDEMLEMYGIDPASLKSPTAKPPTRPAATIAPAAAGAPVAAAVAAAAAAQPPTVAPIVQPERPNMSTTPKVPMTREQFLADFAKRREAGTL